MSIRLLQEKGTPIEKQVFTWKELVQPPISKLDEDAFTRVRIILMNGIESEALRFGHLMFRAQPYETRVLLARVHRLEQHQQTMVNWLLPADQSPLETTIGYEQVAIEVTADVAQKEPDPYLAQVYRYGLLEDFDHMYRYSALMDRVEGKDANNILQNYTDVIPGRPTAVHHRAPENEVRKNYNRKAAKPISKLHALTLIAGEYQTHDFYMHVGPMYADPVARQLYAEIASVEEQHIIHYGSLVDPEETWMEQWLLHEANEVYNYYSCAETETNPRIKAIWERFLDYELLHLNMAMEAFKKIERRDPAEILPESLPEPYAYQSQREFVRQVLDKEVDLRTKGTEFVPKDQEPQNSIQYRDQMNSQGSPSNMVAAGYRYTPGTELSAMEPHEKKGAA